MPLSLLPCRRLPHRARRWTSELEEDWGKDLTGCNTPRNVLYMTYFSLETRTAETHWKVQGAWTTQRTARDHFTAAVENTGEGVQLRVAEYEERPHLVAASSPVAVLATVTK